MTPTLARWVLLPFCASVVWLSTPAFAQAPDHLKCYKIKDPQRHARYSADLTGLAPEPGCLIKVPAKLLCVETAKQNVQPPPPGGGPGGNAAGTFACYKVKCPKGTSPPVAMADQFGTRMVVPGAAKLLCAPASASTTTTSNTTVTTCGGLIPCCFGGMCQLRCRLICGGQECPTVGEPCGSTTSVPSSTTSTT